MSGFVLTINTRLRVLFCICENWIVCQFLSLWGEAVVIVFNMLKAKNYLQENLQF